MTRIEIEGTSIPDHIKVAIPANFEAITTDQYDQNKAMWERAQRIKSDPKKSQLERDLAKSDELHYLLKNTERDDPTSLVKVELGNVALDTSEVEAAKRVSFTKIDNRHSFKPMKHRQVDHRLAA
jgi:hypothetical protein